MLNKSNAHELAQIAKESGAQVFLGQFQYPDPTMDKFLSQGTAFSLF